jgi:hypothetical protein
MPVKIPQGDYDVIFKQFILLRFYIYIWLYEY